MKTKKHDSPFLTHNCPQVFKPANTFWRIQNRSHSARNYNTNSSLTKDKKLESKTFDKMLQTTSTPKILNKNKKKNVNIEKGERSLSKLLSV